MTQNCASCIVDHAELFKQPEYQALFRGKQAFENGAPAEEVARIAEWTKTPEYRELNFQREVLTVNPAKACQPLGAVYAAAGFEGSLPYVHGSQGCVSYFRSHFNRHFKEPVACVSDSMTEDAAVFGGLNNMIDGLANANALYKPKMIAVSTTCMAEVIGDDLDSFIKSAKQKGSIPEDMPVPFAHTPSFVGSHTTGYDGMMKGILSAFWEGREAQPATALNLIGGFDPYVVGNNRELMRILDLMQVEATLLGDNADVWDTPTDGQYRMYDGGTPAAAVREALNAKATLSLQGYCTEKTLEYVAGKGQETVALNYPLGLAGTDRLLMELARLSGRDIPATLEKERGRLVDAMADSQAYLHGRRFAVFGDPDMTLGLVSFLLELGAEPVHVVCTNAPKGWESQMTQLLASSPFGASGKAWAGKDLWHLRSLLATEPVDYLIGSTYGKYLERDVGVPLIRIGFPIFDRHHHHRFPTLGYQGALNVLVKILDRIFDKLDEDKHGISFDAVR